jgi:hypothetical protein
MYVSVATKDDNMPTTYVEVLMHVWMVNCRLLSGLYRSLINKCLSI